MMPSTYDFLDLKLTWRVKGVGHLVENDTDSDPSIIMYFESFDKNKSGAERFDFSHHNIPLSLFRKLSTNTEIQNGELVKQRIRAWIPIDPSELSEHLAPTFFEPVKVVAKLRKQLRRNHLSLGGPSPPRPAFFRHSSYLKLKRNNYDVIIPCAELTRFFFCPTKKLTKAVFSSDLARWIQEHKNGESRNTDNTPKWTDKERQTLDFITKDIRGEVAARLPYKTIIKTGIENHRNGLNRPPFILTRFPTSEKTVLLASYESFPFGVLGLTKRRTYVIGTIYKSLEHSTWLYQQESGNPITGANGAFCLS
ncbi:hypothetical protein ACMSI9_11125 [Pseudomonas fulva]|uniref:hypothetical protein n=1 Tax=Pseudomonas fulva TaxID=47880 RepID=UPI0039C35837